VGGGGHTTGNGSFLPETIANVPHISYDECAKKIRADAAPAYVTEFDDDTNGVAHTARRLFLTG